MGILDSKTRILDVIITQEGRRQIANGKLIIEHSSFSDDQTFYRKDIASGTIDASSRIFFEASSQRQDSIATEADDSGLLLPFPMTSGYEVVNGGIVSGSVGSQVAVTGSSFVALAENVLNTSLQNFSQLMPLATHDEIFDDSQFELSSESISFTLNEDNPLSIQSHWSVNINDVDSLMEDQKFSHIKNFMYLPPITKKNEGETSTKELADYVKLTPDDYEFSRLEEDFSTLQKRGLHNSVQFIQTSRRSRLLLQMFEVDKTKLRKLDVYKYKTFTESNSVGQTDVYFAGKLVPDQNGSYTFIHLFTLAFR